MIDTLLICYVLIGRYHRYQNTKSHHALIDHYTHTLRGTQRARNAELEVLLQISLKKQKKKKTSEPTVALSVVSGVMTLPIVSYISDATLQKSL